MSDTLRIRTVGIVPIVSRKLVNSLNRQLEEIYGIEVEKDILESEPPAAGFTELAFGIAATGAIQLVLKFFEPLITAAGEAYRDDVLRLIRGSRRGNESGRSYLPFHIDLGAPSDAPYPLTPVRYFFHDVIDARELLKRLRAACEHVRTIPPEMFSIMPGGPDSGFFWDEEEQRWRGLVFGYRELRWGEQWRPRRIFDPPDA